MAIPLLHFAYGERDCYCDNGAMTCNGAENNTPKGGYR